MPEEINSQGNVINLPGLYSGIHIVGSIGKCGNCKYWNEGQTVISDTGFGKCRAVIDISNESKQIGVKLDDMLVTDYDGYVAELITGEDFGCIKFERKQ